MDIHVRRLGTVSIIFGVLSLLFSTALFMVYGGPFGMYQSTEDTIFGLIISTSAVAHFLLAIPSIVGGFFLRRLEEWSRGLMIVTCALNIINVPIGSIIGAYGFWVLLTPETDPLFAQKVRSKAKADAGAHLQPKKQSATETIVPSPRS